MFYSQNMVKQYLQELQNELNEYDIHNISSIYIGGGTPTSLEENELEFLLSIVDKYYHKGISYTIEANVENLTLNKIKLLRKHHVSRVSLGIQTFNDNLIKTINRFHNKQDAIEVINSLRENGIKDINIDLIYGLPNETLDDLKKDLEIAISLPITHISTYALSINKNTKMYIDGYSEKSDEEIRTFYDYIVVYLKENGFYRYEVSNFSKTDYESKHNMIYWRNEEYYGIGLGASGYIDGIRYTNTKSINKYLNHQRIYEKETLTKEDVAFYDVMLGLRLKEGIDERKIKNKEKLKELIERGLLIQNDDRISVNEKDLFILDYVLRELL